jgi:thiamine-phosphate pyrophosphorylase
MSNEIGVWRIIDAAANRAGEGLRVVEDYVRFVLDDAHLTSVAKALRHDLAAALAAVPMKARLMARDTLADVGTAIATPSEQVRADLESVLAANAQRAVEAIRSLEEYAKTFDPALASRFESLRYQTYTLHRAAVGTKRGVDRLAGVKLCVLVDGRGSTNALASLADALIAAGVGMIQLRDKNFNDRELTEAARDLRARSRGTETLIIVNDRPDIAALADADGVHVGQDDVTAKDARAIVGAHQLVGVSTHSLEQARRAVLDRADYIGVGPVFASPIKQFAEMPGLPLVASVTNEIRLPAFAIGGITAQNIAEVRAAGAARVAVSSAVVAATDPSQAAKELLECL